MLISDWCDISIHLVISGLPMLNIKSWSMPGLVASQSFNSGIHTMKFSAAIATAVLAASASAFDKFQRTYIYFP